MHSHIHRIYGHKGLSEHVVWPSLHYKLLYFAKTNYMDLNKKYILERYPVLMLCTTIYECHTSEWLFTIWKELKYGVEKEMVHCRCFNYSVQCVSFHLKSRFLAWYVKCIAILTNHCQNSSLRKMMEQVVTIERNTQWIVICISTETTVSIKITLKIYRMLLTFKFMEILKAQWKMVAKQYVCILFL